MSKCLNLIALIALSTSVAHAADLNPCLQSERARLRPLVLTQVIGECKSARTHSGNAAVASNELKRVLNQLIPAGGADRKSFNQNGKDLGAQGDHVRIVPSHQANENGCLSVGDRLRDCERVPVGEETDIRMNSLNTTILNYCQAVADDAAEVAKGKKTRNPKPVKDKKIIAEITSERGECCASERLWRLVRNYSSTEKGAPIKKWLKTNCNPKL